MPEYDMIIRNGTIVDGTGRLPAYRGDVAIKQGKIAMISGRIRASAPQELDATGCIIAPGAIDFLIGGFSPPEGRLARGFKPPAFSRFLFQSAVQSAESF